MLYSMTGFGKSEATIQDKLVSIEIRTLNSKGFDCNVRLPNYLREKELLIRNHLKDELVRGKIDVFIHVELPDELQAHAINQTIAKTYALEIQELANSLQISTDNLLETVLKLPNVLSVPEESLDDQEWDEMEKLIYEAASRVNDFREKEGDKTEEMLQQAIELIRSELKQIENFEQERIVTVKERIQKHIEQHVDVNLIDENRLEQELVYYIEKYDLSEEKMRLNAHLDHFNELLHDESTIAKGKKLNFVSQEIGREINTIGSKANHAEIQRHVVVMKDNLEQIKEQLANSL